MGGTVPACGGPWGPPRCPLPVLVPGLAKPRASGAHSCPQCSEGTADWAWTSEPGDAGGPSLVAPNSGGPASGSQLWEPLPLSPARRPLPPTAGATCTPPGSVRHCPAWRLPCLRATPLHADPQRLAAGTRFLPGRVGGISSLIRVEGTRSGICGKLRESAMHCQSGVVPEAVGGSGPSDRPHAPRACAFSSLRASLVQSAVTKHPGSARASRSFQPMPVAPHVGLALPCPEPPSGSTGP